MEVDFFFSHLVQGVRQQVEQMCACDVAQGICTECVPGRSKSMHCQTVHSEQSRTYFQAPGGLF